MLDNRDSCFEREVELAGTAPPELSADRDHSHQLTEEFDHMQLGATHCKDPQGGSNPSRRVHLDWGLRCH